MLLAWLRDYCRFIFRTSNFYHDIYASSRSFVILVERRAIIERLQNLGSILEKDTYNSLFT